jgi:hypothetical protein
MSSLQSSTRQGPDSDLPNPIEFGLRALEGGRLFPP